MIFSKRPADFTPRFEIVSCFLECGDKFLLLLRQDSKPQGNTWGVPAGKVDPGEGSDHAMRRELEEETGYKIPEPVPLSLVRTVFVRYPKYDFIYHIYRHILSADPEVHIDASAHKSFRWTTPSEALTLELIPDLDACIKLIFELQTL